MPLNNKDFLIEIGTEELPAKGLRELSEKFEQFLLDALKNANISHGESILYATPRRLAVCIKNLPEKQKDMEMERKGPVINAPEKAREGFAKSCGVNLDQLTVQDNYLIHKYNQPGKTLTEYMPAFIEEVLKKIPPGKTMRWGSHTESFIRPIRWILMLHGREIVPTSVFGIPASNVTYGHRFHHPEAITINNPAEYEEKLLANKVIASSLTRQNKILEALSKYRIRWGMFENANPIESTLLHEVTGLVEWPVILEGTFDKKFLSVPQEALISAMQEHQKYFPVGNHEQLEPSFIIVSNIESTNPKRVIQGNERVMRARLSDAEFFYTTDCKRTLENRLDDLKTVTFQTKLGSLYKKAERISKLSKLIASDIGANTAYAERAGWLCKADLTSGMVGEFPELQGVMGKYYAENDKETKEVADAIQEHYFPRFGFDATPKSPVGAAVALADRLDTLVGIFGINQQPTGDKDPFGLRRAAIGLVNILRSQKTDLELPILLQKAVEYYGDSLLNKNVTLEVLKFILERMRAGYVGEGINNSIVLAVEARGFSHPIDFDNRIEAVKNFSRLPEASALAAANKRVGNILIKEKQDNIQGEPNPELFVHPSEKKLWEAILHKKDLKGNDYTKILTELADLQAPVDQFFNDVMVMVDDEALRLNRLRLLNYLRQLFLQVADISLLQE